MRTLSCLAIVIFALAPAAGAATSPTQKIGGLRVKGQYDHAMSRWHTALRISDPWHEGDYFSEPAYPAIPPGKSVQVTGKLYFSEGGIADLHRRYQKDVGSGALQVVVID